MKQLVILFTYSYPYSPPTEQFLHKEVEAFTARDDVNLHIVTMGRNVDLKKKYDSVLRDDDREILLKRHSKFTEVFSGLPKMIGEFPDIAREVGYLCSTKAFSDISRTVQQYIQANAFFKEFLSQYPLENAKGYGRIILYSYWLGTNSILSCMLKKYLAKHLKCPVLAVSRAHGMGDLYFSEDAAFRPALRMLQDGQDMIFSISANGCDVLKKQGFRNVKLFRLGVNRSFGFSCPNKNHSLIVSCSSVDDNKRVIDIAKAISNIRDKDLQWVHFGGGVKEKELREWCDSMMPPNIRYRINGVTPHEDIMQFYADNHPVLFINLSYVEGIPVSIMEAFSYGIPTLATDVGATKELVKNQNNGYLIKRDYMIGEVSDTINRYLALSDAEINQYRENAERTWEREYQEENFSSFVEALLGIEE